MITFVSLTGSTNADLAARLRAGEHVPEGHWLVADRQSAGRGRQGREWLDGLGNFMGSTVVHPRPGDPPAPSLALLAGLAVQETIAALLPAPHAAMLKWPNDIMVGQAKLAGLLLEREDAAVIVGIGVNLAMAPEVPGRETVSLAALGCAVERDRFAESLLRQFATDLARWRDYGLEPVLKRWRAAAHPVGTPLSLGEPGEAPLTGTFAGLSPDGALQLRLADGTTHVHTAGEVRFAAP